MKKDALRLIIMIVSVFIGVEFIAYSGWNAGVDNFHYDLWHCLAGKRTDKTDVIIAVIDDKTLLEHREEPLAFWGPHFAKAIETLKKNGARAIGLDFLFSVSAESWLKKIGATGSDTSRTYDIPFRIQLSSGGVVLSAIIAKSDKDENERLMPPFDYWAVMPGMRSDIGIGNLNSDHDGIVRSFIPNYGIDTDPTLSFPALLSAKSLAIDPKKSQWLSKNKKIANRPLEVPIGFIGPPGSIPRISFSRLISDKGLEQNEISLIKGKTIIIAEENTGTQDIHQTPYSRSFPGLKSAIMTGPEIHANAIETILSERFPEKIGQKTKMAGQAVIIAISCFIFMRLKPLYGLLSGMIIISLAVSFSYFLFVSNIWVPVAGMEYGAVISYLSCLGLKYTGSEKKRKNLRKIFGRYVSDEIVERLASSENIPDLGGEVTEITVLFSDIRNFTTISESLSPKEVVEMINRYLGMACEPILENGGTIDKFIGDAIMAVFGAPAAYLDQAARAIKAAIKLVEIASEFDLWLKKRFPDKNLPEFKIGVGIHKGKALVGNIGSPKRMEYTAMGDVVNTASRLEGLSKTLGWLIVASDEAVISADEALKKTKQFSQIITGEKKSIKVKGREKNVDVCQILSIKDW